MNVQRSGQGLEMTEAEWREATTDVGGKLQTVEVGDVLVVYFGPYRTRAYVAEVNDRGAVLEYQDTAELDRTKLPESTSLVGERLARAGRGFLGRVHFAAAVKEPMHSETGR